MNCFDRPQPQIRKKIAFLLPLFFSILIFYFILTGISSVENATYAKQQESLENALSRSIAQCYAVEGAYPPSLTYLKEHYGLTYDESKFLVDYEYYGSNLLPETVILSKSKQPDKNPRK